jgi:dUTP pyrophosphatase
MTNQQTDDSSKIHPCFSKMPNPPKWLNTYEDAGNITYIPKYTLPTKKLVENAILPTKAHKTDAGYDLYALEDALIMSHGLVKMKTGVAIAIPAGYVGLICDRSGMGSKGTKVLGGVVDHGYTGDVTVCLANVTEEQYFADELTDDGQKIFSSVNQPIQIRKGDRIAQIVIIPIFQGEVEEVNELPESQRGEKGFGSSGA